MNSRFTACIFALSALAFPASAQLAISSNDGKAILVNGVNTVPDKSAGR